MLDKKILIKDENYTSKKESKVLEFYEENIKDVYLTGKNYNEKVNEFLYCNFLNVKNVVVQGLETGELDIKIDNNLPVLSSYLKIYLNDVYSKTAQLTVDKKIYTYFSFNNIKKSFKVFSNFQVIEGEGFDNLMLFVENKNKRIKNINIKRGNVLSFLPVLREKKKVSTKEVIIENVDVVDMLGIEIINNKKMHISGVMKLLINKESLYNLFNSNSDFFMQSFYFYFNFQDVNDLNILKNLLEKNKIDFKYLLLHENSDKEVLESSLILNKNISIYNLLGIRNVEKRVIFTKFIGGLEKALEYEKLAVLKDKNERGELWMVLNENTNDFVKFLKYKDISTGKEYISFIPKNINSVYSAFAWKFKITEEEYKNLTAES